VTTRIRAGTNRYAGDRLTHVANPGPDPGQTEDVSGDPRDPNVGYDARMSREQA
jgi:hypothetical protein